MVKGLNEILILGGVILGSFILFGRKSTIAKGFPITQRKQEESLTLGELKQIESNKERIQFLKETFFEQEQLQATKEIQFIQEQQSAATEFHKRFTKAIAFKTQLQTKEPAISASAKKYRNIDLMTQSNLQIGLREKELTEFLELGDSQINIINQKLTELEAQTAF
jgi:hypothetical protein